MKTTKKREKTLNHKWLSPIFSSQHGASGNRELFNTLFLLVIGLFNLVNYFTDTEATEGLFFAGILITLAVIIYIAPFRKSLLACIFLFLALYVHKDMADGFSSASLFVLAYANMRNKGFGITILIFSALIIVYKSTLINENPSQVAMNIALYTFLYINFYKIFKKAPKPVTVLIKELTEEENDILSKLMAGMGQKEIGDKYKVNRAIRKIKSKLGKESLYEIIAIYSANSCNK